MEFEGGDGPVPSQYILAFAGDYGMTELTYPKNPGNGRPWSLAKAHDKREIDATALNKATRPFQRRHTMMTVVPAFDLVAP
jgi:hypothetical protein